MNARKVLFGALCLEPGCALQRMRRRSGVDTNLDCGVRADNESAVLAPVGAPAVGRVVIGTHGFGWHPPVAIFP